MTNDSLVDYAEKLNEIHRGTFVEHIGLTIV